MSVVEQIRELILEEGLTTGDPLPTEAQLCERLGVSRSSVREAIRTLASLDIVQVRHGHGTFVGEVSLAPLVEGLLFRARLNPGGDLRVLREIVQVRIGLDIAMGEELVERLRGTTNPTLRAHIDGMRTRAAAGEPFTAEDSAFHRGLAEHLDNALVQQLTAAFWQVHAAAVPMLGVPTAEDIDVTVEAHAKMLDALEAGSVEDYREAVKEHYAPLERVLAPTADADAGTGTGEG